MPQDTYPENLRDSDLNDGFKTVVWKCRQSGYNADNINMDTSQRYDSSVYIYLIEMSESEEHLIDMISMLSAGLRYGLCRFSKHSDDYEILTPTNLPYISTNSHGSVVGIEPRNSEEDVVYYSNTGIKVDVKNEYTSDNYIGYSSDNVFQHGICKADLMTSNRHTELSIILPDKTTLYGLIGSNGVLFDSPFSKLDENSKDVVREFARANRDAEDHLCIRNEESDMFKAMINEPEEHLDDVELSSPIFFADWQSQNQKVYIKDDDLDGIRSMKNIFVDYSVYLYY